MTPKQIAKADRALKSLLGVLPDGTDVILKTSDDNDIVLVAERGVENGRIGPVEFNVCDGLPSSRSTQTQFDTLDEALAYFDVVEEAGGFGAIWEANRKAFEAEGPKDELYITLAPRRGGQVSNIAAIVAMATPKGRQQIPHQTWKAGGKTFVSIQVPTADSGRLARLLRDAVADVKVNRAA